MLDRHETYYGINEKMIDEWLARQHQSMGFHEYFRKRDLQLLKIAGTGLGRTEYTLWVGQRMELLRLVQKSKEKHALLDNKKKALQDKLKKLTAQKRNKKGEKYENFKT